MSQVALHHPMQSSVQVALLHSTYPLGLPAACSYSFSLAELRQKAYAAELSWGTILHRKADDLHLPLRQ
eukprot:scaffold274298_cov17-Tisochrysis_lutea.AAC.1